MNLSLEIFSQPGVVCEDRSTVGGSLSMECSETSGIINTTLTLMNQLQAEVFISIQCAETIISSSVNIARVEVVVTGA